MGEEKEGKIGPFSDPRVKKLLERVEGEKHRFDIDEFLINDTVYVCTDQLPYSVVQITESGEREVMLKHSCVGIVGTGADQYCENGQIKTEFVGTCSDAIFCEEQSIRETVTWDQQEYVEISEECAGETIRREIRQQVPEGRYQVVVRDMQNDQVANKVIKEFIIVSNESAS